MDEQEFKNRTKKFSLRVIWLTESLPRTRLADVIGRQLLRAGTSVGANYRAACRAQSTSDMIAKLKDVEEEADESLYWMELLVEANLIPAAKLTDLQKETEGILAMTVSSIKTLRSHNNRKSSI